MAYIQKGICNRLTSLCLDKEFDDKFNSIPNLFPILDNKVVDLLTGEILDRRQDHYFNFVSKVNITSTYNQAEEFFLKLANNDTELSLFLQSLVLYSISGYNYDRAFYMLTGIGRNGKSTFIDIIRYLLTELASCVCSKGLVIKENNSKNEGANPFLLNLKNKRVAVITETEENDKLNTGKIKELTGGDKLTARYLYDNSIIEFTNRAKILIASNFPLTFYNQDTAIVDRYKHIRFENRFEKNNKFRDDLMANKEGILDEIFSLCIKNGREDLKRQSLTCNTIENNTKELMKKFDTISIFLEDKCLLDDKQVQISSTELLNSYKEYCRENGYDRVKDETFRNDMISKGYNIGRGKGKYRNCNVYIGVKLAEESMISFIGQE
ncbi:hypothetical protein EBU94_08030 [bacterium]|nr:hypothetical protein [bacterium]